VMGGVLVITSVPIFVIAALISSCRNRDWARPKKVSDTQRYD
jgi:hypothetical protein